MPSSHGPRRLRRAALAAVAISAVAVALAPGLAAPARAATRLPVNYDFIAGATATALAPDIPPPGANSGSCQLTAAHPYPVILVHGTFENMDDNWQAAAPLLANHGYCVYAFNYGGSLACLAGPGHRRDRRVRGPARDVRQHGARRDRRVQG